MPWFKPKDRFRPTPLRQRLLILALAVATAAVVMLAVLDVPARLRRAQQLPPDKAACGQEPTPGCVGGTLQLMVVPAAAAASAAPAR